MRGPGTRDLHFFSFPYDVGLLNELYLRNADLGIPVSNPGALLFENLCDEAEKRDQDIRGLHIYSDWIGWGVTEIMCNFMNDYNRSFMKKNLNPHELWTYVEAFTCFIKCEDTYMMWWMGMSSQSILSAILANVLTK